MKLHPEVRELSQALHELEAHLRQYDEPQWASQVALCASWVEQSDHYGVERFLGLLGGMGSLNDVVLHRNGAALTTENDQLNALRGRAYELANRLRHTKA